MAAPTDAPTRARTVTPPVTLYWCAFFAVGLSLSLLGPALSELRDRSGADIGSIGVLFVGQAGGYVFGSLAGGRLYDRFVGHRVFAASLAVIALGLLALPSLDSLPPLFAAFVVTGVGASITDVGANTLLMWELGPAGGRSMNVLHLSFGLGALSAPLLVYGGVNLAALVAAFTCLVLAGVALRVRSPIARPVDDQQDASPRPRLLILISSFFLFYVGLEVGFGGWIPTYADEIGFSSSGVAWLTATFWIGFTAGRLAASAIGYRFRPKVVLIGAFVCTLASAGLLVVGDGASLPVWIGTFAIGVATAPQFPVMLNYLERRIHITGKVTSWLVGAAGLGGLVFPWLIGQWIERSGPSALAWAMALLGVICAGSFALTNRRLGG